LFYITLFEFDVVFKRYRGDIHTELTSDFHSHNTLSFFHSYPREWDGQIVFSSGPNSKTTASIPIKNISDFYIVSESKGRIVKKEDRMIHIAFRGNDGVDYWIVIKTEDDKDTDDLFDNMKRLKTK
jgi:hypothetical protein